MKTNQGQPTSRVQYSLFWVGFGNVASKAMMFAANIWIANRLLQEAYGAVNVAFAIVNYTSLVLFAGVDTMTTREVSVEPRGRVGVLTGNVVLLRTTLALVSMMLCAVAAAWLPTGTRKFVLLYALSFIPQSICVVNMFYGAEWAWPVTIYYIGGRVVYLSGLMALVHGVGDAAWVPLAFCAAIAAENIFLFSLWIRRHGVSFAMRGVWARWLPAVPITCACAAVLLHENAAVVVLGFMRGNAEAGIYSASYRLVYVAISMAGLLSYVYMARFIRIRAGGGHEACGFFRRATLIALLGGVACAIGCMVLARLVVGVCYTSDYAASGTVLMIGAWQMAAAPARVLAFQTLNACGAYAQAIVGGIVGMLASVGATVVGAHAYGAAGAAAGTVAGEVAIAAIMLVLAHRTLHTGECDGHMA